MQSFWDYVKRVLTFGGGITESCRVNMDETPLYIEPIASSTLEVCHVLHTHTHTHR